MIPDRIEMLLGMMSTVNALMLGTAMSLTVAISHDEWEAAAQRFGPNGIYSQVLNRTDYLLDLQKKGLTEPLLQNYKGGNYMTQVHFLGNCSQSVTMLSTSLTICLMVYFALAATSFRDPWKERNTKLLRAWCPDPSPIGC